MNKAEFTDLIVNPAKLGNEHIDTLKKIVADYPYFSTAQILLAKALLNTNHYEYEKQLKTTALSVLNREILHQFLNNIPEETEIENSIVHISEEIKEVEVPTPDFESEKFEQEALLTEAQNIISNHQIPLAENTYLEETIENETESNIEIALNLAETFLPDFDEASLLTDSEQIETITKSVLPNTLPVSNFEIEPPIIENNEEPILNFEDSNIEHLESNVEDVLTNSNTTIESDPILIENILENNSDNIIIPIETSINENFETIEELVLSPEMANAVATIEATNLNFFEWLKINKKESENKNNEIAKSQEISYYEDADFVAKIKQIIKTKAEYNLEKSIIIGIEKAHDNTLPFERKSNISESIEETIENIELAENIIEEINNESFVDANENNLASNIDNKIYDSNKDSLESNAIYTSEVESILPDFEALNKQEIAEEEVYFIYDKKEGLIPNYETPVFDPLFNSHFETKPSVIEPAENEELVDFNDFTIDEGLFENSFSTVYIPLPTKEIEKEIDSQPTNETKNEKTVTSKNEIDNILDKFMRENPSISRPKTEFFNPVSVAKTSVEEKDEIVSETLASIYLKQGLIKKSILTYEKLCLIYPHKNTYFAALINKIKTEHNIN